MSITTKVILIMFCSMVFISGCKTTEPMYYYGDYSKAVYSYFKADETSVSQQIIILEEIIVQASGKGKPVAPGVHAHLGMLYFESGNQEQGINHSEQEKVLFPESVAYIDFLIKNTSGMNI
ncbi:DUF4810 domain-containing protein [uncultured Paraglaciecola sp.]|uniref:DUF4810 domain-containing protein n=1 Tax=uncultured Paraglaciecola sp. TaxID=1765024 RepID=UPI0025F706C9|nr:DUF4810 domain-containing protein [uncultured Paraglaciecola sp.]